MSKDFACVVMLWTLEHALLLWHDVGVALAMVLIYYTHVDLTILDDVSLVLNMLFS